MARDWPTNIKEAAKKAAGNWTKFGSFGWHDKPDHPEDWTIYYTSNRDSGLADQSNEAAIAKVMDKFSERDVRKESHNHWAVGYVDGYAVRVYKAPPSRIGIFPQQGAMGRQITPAFEALYDLVMKMQDYPLLDEDDHSRREYEATLENIEQAGRNFVADNAPEDWPNKVFRWLWDNDQGAIESDNDQGGYPNDDELKEALGALGYLDEYYQEEEA
jgi:hypothetical protein